MSGVLWPKAKGSAAPELAGFRVQSSVYGLPIPIVYGTARIAGNLIDFVPGDTVQLTSKPSKWATPTPTGWAYLNSLALALCEGPIIGVGDVWADKDGKADFNTVVGPRDLWTIRLGTDSQTAIGYLSSDAPYQYTAYVAVDLINLPNNVLPNYSWEIQGLLIFGSGVVDALPADVIDDVLTNPIHGSAFPADSVGPLTDYEDYCAAAGLFVSPALTTIRSTADVLDELMMATNSAIVWSDGLLKIIPYGDEPLSGHGHTFTPNTTPVYDLSDDDYLAGEGQDPVSVTRKNATELYNQLFVEFENRDNDYNADVREAKNDADILVNGLRPAPKLSLPLVKDPSVARTVAQLHQQREQFVVNEYRFQVGWKFSLLEPMDLITLTDAGLGLDFTPVRITEVVELEDGAGIDITAEDWPFGSASATLYPSEDPDGHRPNNNVDPGDTTTPVIFNGPGSLTVNALEIWFAASGGPFWGGCDIWLSADGGVTYRKVGTISDKATFGELTADLNEGDAYPLVDSINTLSVDISASESALDSQTAEDFAALVPTCYVDQEFLAFQIATPTGSFQYDLDTLYRAIRESSQTPAPGHLTGSAFVLIDETIFKLFYPQGFAGQVLYFKFPAFNVYQNSLQSLASVSPVIYTVQNPIGGDGPTVEEIMINITSAPCDGGGTMEVSWTATGTPAGATFTVLIEVTGGARGAHTETYTNVTSGDPLAIDLCPDSFGDVTVTMVKGAPLASVSTLFS